MCVYTLHIDDTFVNSVRHIFPTRVSMEKWLQEQVTLSLKKIESEHKAINDIHIFDGLNKDFGGNRSANDIAEELRHARQSKWDVEPW